MTTRFLNSILHKTEEVGLVDNNLIRSIATNIINGLFFLFDFLCILLAINSFPDPEGPFIIIRLSVIDIL